VDLACQAPSERRRAGIAIGTALLVLALVAVVMVVVPLSKIRRQGLTPVDQRFAETLRRVADLASSEGVRPATVLVGKRVPSPFCPVRPGAYRIMVTPGSPTFTALIRHELAHLAHRDVTLSRLGRTLGWVLFPLLALPMITAARRLLLSAQLRKAQLEQMFDNMEW
jgi:hypothetical protein